MTNIGRNEEAEQVTREAVAIFQRAASRDPSEVRTRRGLAICYYHLSCIEGLNGRIAEALHDLQLADDFHAGLAADFPNEVDYRGTPAAVRLAVANYLAKSGHRQEVAAMFGDAAAAYQKLADDTQTEGARATKTRNGFAITAADNAWYRHELGYLCSLRGSLLHELGQLPEAEAELSRGVEVHAKLVADFPAVRDYKNRLAWNQINLARVRKARGDRPGAEQAYRDAVAVTEDIGVGHEHVAKVHDELGELYREDGRLVEAVEIRRKAVAAWQHRAAETNGDDDRRRLAETNEFLGGLLLQTGGSEEAASAYLNARDVWVALLLKQPDSADYFQHLCQTYRGLSAALASAGRHDEALEPLLKIADCAEKRLQDSARQWLSVREIHTSLAKFFFAAGRIPQGAKAYGLTIEQRPQEPGVWGRRGEFYACLGLWDRAAHDMAMDCRLEPAADTHQWLAHALLSVQVGDLEAYRQVCGRLPELFPPGADCGDLENELVRACTIAPTADADLAWAMSMAEKGVERRPDAGWEQFALGLARFRAGDDEAAIEPLNKSIAWQAGCLSHPALALVYHRLGREQEAREALDRAAQAINPWLDACLWNQTGWVPVFWWDWLCALLLYREAVTAIEGGAPLDDARLIAVQARSWAALGETQAADEACRRALELGAGNLRVCLACAMTYAELGQPSEADAALAAAAGLKPDSAQDLYLLALVAQKLGKQSEAIDAYAKTIEAEPTNALAYNNLAWLYATRPALDVRDATKAVALAKKAVELKPTDGSSWNTLGAAQYRAGDWQAAIEALTTSMQLRAGGDACNWFFLAMSRWQQGDREQARKLYTQAIEWMAKNQPNDEELHRFRDEAAELLGVNATGPQTPPAETNLK